MQRRHNVIVNRINFITDPPANTTSSGNTAKDENTLSKGNCSH